MSEYVEDFEESEDDTYERLAALEEEAADRADEDRINATIRGLEESYGYELTDEQAQVLGGLIDEYGFDPISAWESLDLGPNDLEEEFHSLTERIEQDQGRALTETERERVWESVTLADREDHDTVDVSGAILDLDDSEQRADYIGEKLRVPREQDEPSTPAINGDGEEVAAFDLSNSTDRAAVIDRMMAGEDAAVIENEGD